MSKRRNKQMKRKAARRVLNRAAGFFKTVNARIYKMHYGGGLTNASTREHRFHE